MRRIAASSMTAVALTAIQACIPGSRVDVVAADGALCDITRRLAASTLQVSCLLGPNDDPHQLQLTPAQTSQINQAQLVLINGYNLTPALEGLNGAVKVAEIAVPQSPALNTSQPGEVHAHGNRDPHVWQDPRQASAMVTLVSQKLEELKPAAAAEIQNRAQAMQHNLKALDSWNRQQFGTIPAPRILASGHRAFASLARAYQLQELPVVDATSTSEALRPQTLTSAVTALRHQRVRSLFTEHNPPSKALMRISRLSNVPLASQPLRADSAGNNLMATLTTNTRLIVEALGGHCDQGSGAALVRSWSAIQ